MPSEAKRFRERWSAARGHQSTARGHQSPARGHQSPARGHQSTARGHQSTVRGPWGSAISPPWEVCIGRDPILMNGPEKDNSTRPETRKTAKSAKKCDFSKFNKIH